MFDSANTDLTKIILVLALGFIPDIVSVNLAINQIVSWLSSASYHLASPLICDCREALHCPHTSPDVLVMFFNVCLMRNILRYFYFVYFTIYFIYRVTEYEGPSRYFNGRRILIRDLITLLMHIISSINGSR